MKEIARAYVEKYTRLQHLLDQMLYHGKIFIHRPYIAI